MNRVILVGRLAADPDVRAGAKGSVTRLRVATNHYSKDAEGNRVEHADFHDCVAFGRTGELAGQFLGKGREVCVEGRLRTSSWDAPEGRRWRTEVVVDDLQFLGARTEAAA